MNLSTWICLASAMPQVLNEVITQQHHTLLSQQHEICHSTCDNLINNMHPFSFTAGLAENEVFHLGQMLRQDDRGQFADAMDSEINGHVKNNHWEVVHKSEVQGNQIIKSTWSFKRKRTPAGKITKHKARICAHGGMQRWGELHCETHAPAVNWLNVRFLLTMSVALDLDTRAIDFTMAYAQAPLKVPVCMEILWGFKPAEVNSPEAYCLKLLVNWCGLKDGGSNWYDCIKSGLEDRGFVQSQIDPYLFTRGSLMIILYVDDVLIAAKHSTHIDNLISSLKEGIDIDTGKQNHKLQKFQFTDDGCIKTFLGVNADRAKDGYHLAQPHLIKRIFDAAGLEADDAQGRNTRDTPAVKPLLIKDANGEKRILPWNHRSVIGMLNYLAGSTRLDVSMAAHQVA